MARFLAIIGSCLILLFAPMNVHTVSRDAQFSPLLVSSFDEFEAFELAELQNLQVKLTYLGEQTRPILTVVFGSLLHVVSMENFKPFRKSGVDYGNDDLPTVRNFTSRPDELQRMIQLVGTIPVVRAGVREGEFLSFMMVNELRGEIKGFEAILNARDAESLLRLITASLDIDNGIGLMILNSFSRALFP